MGRKKEALENAEQRTGILFISIRADHYGEIETDRVHEIV
jgi:hypothetical protein